MYSQVRRWEEKTSGFVNQRPHSSSFRCKWKGTSTYGVSTGTACCALGQATVCWAPPRYQALVQAFSSVWSDFIVAIILWSRQHPGFQTGNQRLKEFSRQWSGCPSFWIQGQLSPKSMSFGSRHSYLMSGSYTCVQRTNSDSARQMRLCNRHWPQPQLPWPVIHQKQGPVPESQASIPHL